MTTVVEEPLLTLLSEHHTLFSPRYSGFLSDHGPMTALALLDLGATTREATAYLQRYWHRLDSLENAPEGHAYRVLYDFAGPRRDAILALGLMAAYAAVGAPGYEPPQETASALSPPDWHSLVGDDEHDIKLACSADGQARFFSDPAWVAVAADYLQRAR